MLQAEHRDESQDNAKIWGQRKETDPQTYVSLYDSWSSLKYSLPLGVSSSLPPPMSSLHFLLSLSILTLSARGLPCLQESMARRRTYGLRGGNTFCASLSPFHERLFHDDTNIESFLCSLPFQALMTIPQISTNKWADSLLQKCFVPTNTYSWEEALRLVCSSQTILFIDYFIVLNRH